MFPPSNCWSSTSLEFCLDSSEVSKSSNQHGEGEYIQMKEYNVLGLLMLALCPPMMFPAFDMVIVGGEISF